MITRVSPFAAAAALALLMPLAALAATPTANVAWTAPTAYVTGESLPASDIASYTVKACEVNSPGTCITKTVAAPTTSIANMALVCGEYDFTVTVTTGAGALHPNETSGPSNIVPFATGVSCSPNPPAGVTVTPGTTG